MQLIVYVLKSSFLGGVNLCNKEDGRKDWFKYLTSLCHAFVFIKADLYIICRERFFFSNLSPIFNTGYLVKKVIGKQASKLGEFPYSDTVFFN